MAAPIVECIPNFSEARRPEVVEAIMDAIQQVEGATVLDRHSDIDHNRTVITFVGAPAAVEEAAYQAIARAAQLIDLNQHTGEHPRIGATDVVPFVPISQMSMQECVEIARRLGQRVGRDLSIPVYLYEEAATRPERHNLENIRRGEYEALKEEIGVAAEREPDFGPSAVGPAGATVIGARQPLIAFNAYLTTPDITIAQKIAKAVRHSSGGLRFVKALGLHVEGLAQVSMNLTNFRQTPIARAVEMIRREAERYGTTIHHTELVGLVPQEALNDAATWYLQLNDFDPEQVLEHRLAVIASRAQTTPAVLETTFIDRLAAATPTPGGGAASAYAGAAGAALVAMVARLTVGRKKYADVEPQMWSVLEQAETLRVSLTKAVEQDMAAFESILAAMSLPKEGPENQAARTIAIEEATRQAIRVPAQVAGWAVEIMALALQAAANGNLNAISDAGSGAAMARAALNAAALNVRTNTNALQDVRFSAPILEQLTALEAQAAQIENDLARVLAERGKISA